MAIKKDSLPSADAPTPMPRQRSILDLRDEPAIAPDRIPAGSASAQQLAADGPLKIGLLRLAESESAESLLAIHELGQSAAQMATDMGHFAPDARQAAAIYERLVQTTASNAKAQALARLTAAQEDVARHDAASFLNAALDEVKHADGRIAGVAAHYPHLMKFDAQRRGAISEGIARKQAEKQAMEEAVTKAEKKTA